MTSEPTTAAGRALIKAFHGMGDLPDNPRDVVCAIEAEASAAAEAAVDLAYDAGRRDGAAEARAAAERDVAVLREVLDLVDATRLHYDAHPEPDIAFADCAMPRCVRRRVLLANPAAAEPKP